MRKLVVSLALLPLLAVAGRAQQVLFTNFGPGFTYNGVSPGDVSGSAGPCGPQALAAQFQPSVSAFFQDAKLPLDLIAGTNQVSVYLETDASGSPGTIIEGPINVTGLVASPGSSVITANSVLHPFLLSGTPYWLVAFAANSNTCAGWFFNSTGDTSTANNFAANSTPSPTGPWIFLPPGVPRPAFQIDGNPALDTGFQTHYSANLNIGESYIDIANDGANGASLLGPGFGAAAGNLCVNVYAFDPNEELVSCCSCLVTPDQTVNLGVNADLTSKTLTGVVPTSVTVKLVATLAGAGGTGTGTVCNNSAASITGIGQLVAGMAAWGTTLHQTTGTYATTETPFTAASLNAAELSSIVSRCAAIIGNASGFGICNSCRNGALGAQKL